MSRSLGEVFGISRGIPLSYRSRNYVDDKLVNNLTRDKHIVVFGGSKQGKTCLRKHCLERTDYEVVQCTASTTRASIYEMLLKHAGASVSSSNTRTVTGEMKLHVEVEAKAAVPLVSEFGANAGLEGAAGEDTAVTTVQFDIDVSDANDVIRVLVDVGFRRYVVLEDFHYLPEEVQREIAVDLKAFHEKSNICFVVVGVWLESNKLVLYNGDLAGRLIPIDADRWDAPDLLAVIEAGEPLLNISFPVSVKEALVRECQDNVGLLQEACYRLCEASGVYSTCSRLVTVGSVEKVEEVISDIALEHAGRYQNFLEQFVEGFQKTELEMYRWIAYILVTSSPSELKRGIRLSQMFRRLNEIHPQRGGRLLQNNVAQALKSVPKLQQKHRVQPIILDYENNANELRVVDSGFILYVASQPRESLVERIGVVEEIAI